MKTAKTLSFAIALALGASAAAGCSGSEPGDDVVDDDDDVDDDQDDDVDQTGVSPVGRYALASELDLAAGLPGTVGDVVNTLIAATDGPDDPGRWICDTAADQLDGTLGDIAHGACALAGGYINDQILAIAPDFVDALLEMADRFGQIARNFGIRSELDIVAQGQGFISRHTMTGVAFDVDSQVYAFTLADYGGAPVEVPNVGLDYQTTGNITIAAHDVPAPYGTILRIGLDEVIIPMIDPLATDLGDLMLGLVDCYQVGWAIYDAIGFGSVSTYEAACESGLQAGAGLVYDKIGALGTVTLNIAGAARAMDTDGDKQVDEITRGTWTGNMIYGSTPAPLANATFAGDRM